MPRQPVYRVHAIQRMFERGINRADVRRVIDTGEVIENYPNDTPYPSRFLLGFVDGQPLHVLAAENAADNETIVVTVYKPDPAKWDAEFRRRIR
jgi:hypothetical protein